MAEVLESLAELAFSRLKTSTNPGVILSQFFSSITGIPCGRSEIIKLNLLVKIFGRTSVFFAIIDCSRVDNLKEFPYGLIYKICKDRLEAALGAEMTSHSYDSIERMINKYQDNVEKVKKIDPIKAGKIFEEG